MPKPILQSYYCIIKKKKFGEYALIIRENTSTAKVRKELKKEGYRVLVCVTAHGLLKLQQADTFEEFLKYRPSSYWNENAFNFMKEINPKLCPICGENKKVWTWESLNLSFEMCQDCYDKEEEEQNNYQNV